MLSHTDTVIFSRWPWSKPLETFKNFENFETFEAFETFETIKTFETVEIFDTYETFDFEVTLGQKYVHHSKAHICLPILLLLALSLYLVPFSRYSTSQFLGFDLDLRPLGVTRGQKYFHYLRAHKWLPI